MAVTINTTNVDVLLVAGDRPGPLALRRSATDARIIEQVPRDTAPTSARRRRTGDEREDGRASAHVVLLFFDLFLEIHENARPGFVVRGFALLDGEMFLASSAGTAGLGGLDIGKIIVFAVDGAGAGLGLGAHTVVRCAAHDLERWLFCGFGWDKVGEAP